MKILFTYLTAFIGHGGIEKFNKAFIKALGQISVDTHFISSAYDVSEDKKYKGDASFKAYKGKRIRYVVGALRDAVSSNILVVGHINLALVGVVAKLLNPSLKLILVVHGIDVWYELSSLKRQLLAKADLILSVSSFTKTQLINKHNVAAAKIKLFPNTLDPFFDFPSKFQKPAYLLSRYNITDQQPVILSLCRLSSKEGYKGYDTVIQALPQIINHFPDLRYLIVGKYDEDEFSRISSLIKKLNVKDHVILSGFVPDEELTDHYLISNLFIMPSREEGFGIVYIEAMACGLPVIAGNMDGSVDALDHGRLGTLVNPNNINEIAEAVIKQLNNKLTSDQKEELQQRVVEKFGFDKFAIRLATVLAEI